VESGDPNPGGEAFNLSKARGKQGVRPLRKFSKILAGACAAALMSTTAAVAADKIKVGIITTLVKGARNR